MTAKARSVSAVRVVAHEAAKQAVLWEVGGVRDREGTEARSEGVATRVATVTVAEAAEETEAAILAESVEDQHSAAPDEAQPDSYVTGLASTASGLELVPLEEVMVTCEGGGARLAPPRLLTKCTLPCRRRR